MSHACECDRHRGRHQVVPEGASVNALLRALVAELEAEEIPAPLWQPLTLAAVWADLCRIAGEEPPAAVQVYLDEPAAGH